MNKEKSTAVSLSASVRRLAVESNRLLYSAQDSGNFPAALFWLAASYPLELGATVVNGEYWTAAQLVLFFPVMAPTGIIATAVLCVLAKWQPFKFRR